MLRDDLRRRFLSPAFRAVVQLSHAQNGSGMEGEADVPKKLYFRDFPLCVFTALSDHMHLLLAILSYFLRRFLVCSVFSYFLLFTG